MADKSLNISSNLFWDDNVSVPNATNFDYPEPYKSIGIFLNWAIIGLVLVSLTGNTIIIVVMSRKQNRNSSASTFFTALAVSDMSLSLSVSFERWLYWVCNVSVYSISPYMATAKTIYTYSNIQFSSWMLICITVERILSIAVPFKVREICTKVRAVVTISIVCIVILTLNAFEFTLIISPHFDERFGMSWVAKVENGREIVSWMDFISSFFIPVAVISLGSVYIVAHLIRISIRKESNTKGRNRSVTTTLLAANVAFIVTMSPYVIWQLVYPTVAAQHSSYFLWTMTDVFLFLSDANAALNFFVYVLSGSKFRSDVKQIFRFQETSLAKSNDTAGNNLS